MKGDPELSSETIINKSIDMILELAELKDVQVRYDRYKDIDIFCYNYFN